MPILLTKTHASKFQLQKYPQLLPLNLQAVLVDWLVNILASAPDRFSTIIICLDIVGVDTGPCGFTNLNRSYKFCSRISSVLLIYKSKLLTNTQIVILLRIKFDRILGLTFLHNLFPFSKMKGVTR